MTCRHLDSLLGGIEEVLGSSSSRRAFPKYVADVTHAQRAAIERQIAEIRGNLLRILASRNLAAPQPEISALHAIRVSLDFLGIDLEELAPRHMRGYGQVGEAAAEELQRIVRELGGALNGLQSYIRGLPGASASQPAAVGPEEALDALRLALQSFRQSTGSEDRELRSAS